MQLTDDQKANIKKYLSSMQVLSISSYPVMINDKSSIGVIVVNNGVFCPLYVPEKLKEYV